MPDHTLAIVNEDIRPHSYKRSSVLNKNMARILERPDVWGLWVSIATYENKNTASCTAWSLRQRFPVEEGWSIRSKKLDPGGPSHLIACYQPPEDQ